MLTTSPALTALPRYSGPWTATQAAHLLRRTGYGLRLDELRQLSDLTPEAAVDLLLEERPLGTGPLNFTYPDDPNVPIGESWAGHPNLGGLPVNRYRNQSLRAWMVNAVREERLSVRERMFEFVVNHFGASVGGVAEVRHAYLHLLKENALGNFRELIKKVTIEPVMLQFLDGARNNANSPNENYARELLELFTVGKGPQIAPGDYTNYTEDDVRAFARALTGWRVGRTVEGDETTPVISFFVPRRHDVTDKQLSHHFGGQVITDAGENEYLEVVDRIFAIQGEAVARHICRKLYRHFVYYQIDDAVEREVIDGLAATFIEHDFELRPVLRDLFLSEHFYATENLGPMIKNPTQLAYGVLRTFDYEGQIDAIGNENRRRLLTFYYYRASLMDMDFLDLPSVAGWPAYHQEPAYYRLWINSSTLQERGRFAQAITGRQGIGTGEGVRVRIDYLNWIKRLSEPNDPNVLIRELTELLLPLPLSDARREALKGFLLPGLPDFEWTVEYGTHLANPADEELALSVEAKLLDLLRAIFDLAEFQLT